MVSLAYEQLARLSVFVDVARRDEIDSYHDLHHHNFTQLFHRLETDASGGLYTVMCALKTVYQLLVDNRWNNAYVPILGHNRRQAIRRIRVPAIRNRARRHFRDFSVVKTLLNVASRLVVDIKLMARRLPE